MSSAKEKLVPPRRIELRTSPLPTVGKWLQINPLYGSPQAVPQTSGYLRDAVAGHRNRDKAKLADPMVRSCA
jgi:hypothetical protein